MLDRVLHKVGEHLADRSGISLDDDIGLQVEIKLERCFFQSRLKRCKCLANNMVEIEGAFFLALPVDGDLSEVSDKFPRPAESVFDDVRGIVYPLDFVFQSFFAQALLSELSLQMVRGIVDRGRSHECIAERRVQFM